MHRDYERISSEDEGQLRALETLLDKRRILYQVSLYPVPIPILCEQSC